MNMIVFFEIFFIVMNLLIKEETKRTYKEMETL